ncbi:hydralysin-2 [Bacillus thuringiensis]|uniref:Hydralysin-2 n=1 Tax=Bacillus thuringiensis TaxID=1428 RepID=A0A9X7BMV2_BACTU|nr:hydralysin-2 [Bacillus thuringiensis]MED4446272.1 hydralysin-2 [Bacillus cereus]PEB43973.1 hydralysin-2 [Bacillus thuringiensis]PED27090.1 hydralysin-2 [Bacillus thuringiensis]PFV29615.1 hydralysin-2 [Bacillus thuringiensis]
MIIQEKLTFSDLDSLNSTTDSIMDAFKDLYGILPDEIAVNNETFPIHNKPAITERYGHACYKMLGPFIFRDLEEPSINEITLKEQFVYNPNNEEKEVVVAIKEQWANIQSWTSKSITGLTLKSDLIIEGKFQSGNEFNISTFVGESNSKSIHTSPSIEHSIKVPPNSKMKIAMIGTLITEVLHFQSIITVQGMFGACFPRMVRGHYVSFKSAGHILNKTFGIIEGSINNTVLQDIEIDIKGIEPYSYKHKVIK